MTGLLTGVERTSRAALNKTIGVGKADLSRFGSEKQYMADLQKSAAVGFLSEGVKGKASGKALNIEHNKDGIITSMSLDEDYAKGVERGEATNIAKTKGFGELKEVTIRDKDGKKKKVKATLDNLMKATENSELLNQSMNFATNAKLSDRFGEIDKNGNIGNITSADKIEEMRSQDATNDFINKQLSRKDLSKEQRAAFQKIKKDFADGKVSQADYIAQANAIAEDNINKTKAEETARADMVDTAKQLVNRKLPTLSHQELNGNREKAVEDIIKSSTNGTSINSATKSLLANDKEFAKAVQPLLAQADKFKEAKQAKEASDSQFMVAKNAQAIAASINGEDMKSTNNIFQAKFSQGKLNDPAVQQAVAQQVQANKKREEAEKTQLAIESAQSGGGIFSPFTNTERKKEIKNALDKIDRGEALTEDEKNNSSLMSAVKKYKAFKAEEQDEINRITPTRPMTKEEQEKFAQKAESFIESGVSGAKEFLQHPKKSIASAMQSALHLKDEAKQGAMDFITGKGNTPSNTKENTELFKSSHETMKTPTLDQSKLSSSLDTAKKDNTHNLSLSEMAGVMGTKKTDAMIGDALATQQNLNKNPNMIMENVMYGEMANQQKTAAKIEAQGGIKSAVATDLAEANIKSVQQQKGLEGNIEALMGKAGVSNPKELSEGIVEGSKKGAEEFKKALEVAGNVAKAQSQGKTASDATKVGMYKSIDDFVSAQETAAVKQESATKVGGSFAQDQIAKDRVVAQEMKKVNDAGGGEAVKKYIDDGLQYGFLYQTLNESEQLFFNLFWKKRRKDKERIKLC